MHRSKPRARAVSARKSQTVLGGNQQVIVWSDILFHLPDRFVFAFVMSPALLSWSAKIERKVMFTVSHSINLRCSTPQTVLAVVPIRAWRELHLPLMVAILVLPTSSCYPTSSFEPSWLRIWTSKQFIQSMYLFHDLRHPSVTRAGFTRSKSEFSPRNLWFIIDLRPWSSPLFSSCGGR